MKKEEIEAFIREKELLVLNINSDFALGVKFILGELKLKLNEKTETVILENEEVL